MIELALCVLIWAALYFFAHLPLLGTINFALALLVLMLLRKVRK